MMLPASTLPAATSSLSASGPSRMRSAKVPSLILATAGPVPNTLMLTVWPLARSNDGMRPFMICSTAPVVTSTTSSARAAVAIAAQRQPRTATEIVKILRMLVLAGGRADALGHRHECDRIGLKPQRLGGGPL